MQKPLSPYPSPENFIRETIIINTYPLCLKTCCMGFAPAGATRAFRSPWTFGGILAKLSPFLHRKVDLPAGGIHTAYADAGALAQADDLAGMGAGEG